MTCASHTALKHRATRRKAQGALEGVLCPIRGFSITITAVYGRKTISESSFPQFSQSGTIALRGAGETFMRTLGTGRLPQVAAGGVQLLPAVPGGSGFSLFAVTRRDVVVPVRAGFFSGYGCEGLPFGPDSRKPAYEAGTFPIWRDFRRPRLVETGCCGSIGAWRCRYRRAFPFWPPARNDRQAPQESIFRYRKCQGICTVVARDR